MRLFLLCSVLASAAPLMGQQVAPSTQPQPNAAGATLKQAELLRSTSGTLLDEKGFSKGSVALKKGDNYEVTATSISDVTVKDGDKLVKIPKDAVQISEVAASEANLGPSSLAIISAKLGYPKERQYEVKEEVKKIIKKRLESGPITATKHVDIPVQKEMLRSKAATASQETVMIGDSLVTRQRPSAMMLTITYEFEGKRQEKTAPEGSTISLP